MKSSGIGGQAVIEGIMMKNKNRYSVAVRKPDKQIAVIEKEFVATTEKSPILNLPLIRGGVSFIDSLRIGISTLTYSSSFYEDDEGETPGKLDEFAGKLFKDKLDSVINGITVVLSVIIAVVLFMLVPFWISRLLYGVISSNLLLNVIEGVLRLIIFLIYVVLISQMQDIKRVFMYHGAEHKSINCIEHGMPLTVENVRKSSRLHKRCGTSFMLFVMIISIILFMFIQFDSKLVNFLVRLVLIPVIAGISYEILKLAGNSDNAFINVISKPGLWLQRLTTKEPDDDMIEVAITAVEKVFDWREFIAGLEEEDTQEDVFEFIDMEEIDKISSIDDIDDIFEADDELTATSEAEEKTDTPEKENSEADEEVEAPVINEYKKPASSNSGKRKKGKRKK